MTYQPAPAAVAVFNRGCHPVYWVVLAPLLVWLGIGIFLTSLTRDIAIATVYSVPLLLLFGAGAARLLQPRPVTLDPGQRILRVGRTEIPLGDLTSFQMVVSRGGWWINLRDSRRRIARLMLHGSPCRPVTATHYRVLYEALLEASRSGGMPAGHPVQRARRGDIAIEHALPMLLAQANWVESGAAPTSSRSPIWAMVRA
ncbi:hypothetical protein [Gulosibacter sp. ACHW.36C]|uniref:PH domain-containing protein n=1 Tax=Gulosibacter sediminis TaxID=1729695 RepID=A0ABY4MWG5_9MICO|nr:hypothetical protein [Gulosibacter sediminis]UQN14050.1 hypothetical protein M3M28_08255 [Gulosibacter sediminis]